MPETPELGIPYPAATDAVTDWPTQAQELAETVEAVVLEAAAEIAYTQKTTDTSLPSGATTTIIALPATDYDGATVWVEVYIAMLQSTPTSAGGGGGSVTVSLYENGVLVKSAAGLGPQGDTDRPHVFRMKHTPAAGSRTLDYRAVHTGTGGAGNAAAASPLPPAYIRATRAEA